MERAGRQNKQLIDDRALRLLVEKRVTATNIRDIAGTAGIAEGNRAGRHHQPDPAG
jgi:AcrR family transcriptional regulator